VHIIFEIEVKGDLLEGTLSNLPRKDAGAPDQSKEE
jgi:hypothetical protein